MTLQSTATVVSSHAFGARSSRLSSAIIVAGSSESLFMRVASSEVFGGRTALSLFLLSEVLFDLIFSCGELFVELSLVDLVVGELEGRDGGRAAGFTGWLPACAICGAKFGG